jgi:hypothetical protein
MLAAAVVVMTAITMLLVVQGAAVMVETALHLWSQPLLELQTQGAAAAVAAVAVVLAQVVQE